MPDIPMSSSGKKEMKEMEKDWEKMQMKSLYLRDATFDILK